MNSRYDTVGEDLISDALIARLQERDNLQVINEAVRKGVVIDRIDTLIGKGYTSLGTGFYRDAAHHIWKIEKEGDSYLLIRADEIFDTIPEAKRGYPPFKQASISGGASIEEVNEDKVDLIKAVLKERKIRTYEASPIMISRIAQDSAIELNSKEIKAVANTYRYVPDRGSISKRSDWKVRIDNRYR